jgi:hypothetical protein
MFRPSWSAPYADQLSSANGGKAMRASEPRRRIEIMLAVAALCAAVVGCVSDTVVPTAENSRNNQPRYYGGPKSPMWSGQ